MAGSPYLMVALTGVIGSGKSAAAARFAERGAEIIDADILAREVVVPGSPALKEIEAAFGRKVILPEGTLDRKLLGKIVFDSPEERKKLEAIIHPRIRELFLSTKAKFEGRPKHPQILIYVVPLLFESSNTYPEIQKIVVVYAPREACITRIMKRDDCSHEIAERKLNTQISIDEKVKKADYVIDNSSSLTDLKHSVDSVYDALLKEI